jgi:hypothetical protein
MNPGLTKKELESLKQNEILSGEEQVLNAIEPEEEETMDNCIEY